MSEMTANTSASSELLYTSMDSPIGELLLVGDGRSLRGLYMQHGRKPARVAAHWRRFSAPFDEVKAQLAEYFAGARCGFDVVLAPRGGAFERRVWGALREIPYGQTATYGEVARRLGCPAAARAVGLANARNPISIIVPCHRVIGAEGGLIGYGGGLERKRRLLELESGQARLWRDRPARDTSQWM
jgi:methylated-DNA-[protein]-cysteine S-methyltransferase